jgi:choline dehydrogenase-like flavoprotein
MEQSACAGISPRSARPGRTAPATPTCWPSRARPARPRFHPTSTCRRPGSTAVVDERLRLRGFERLRVVDGSIMPTVVSGNTNAAIVLIGEKGADMILEDAAAHAAAAA